MDFSVYLKNRINKFLDEAGKKEETVKRNYREDEYNIMYLDKDYENEIKKYLDQNNLVAAKKTYKELLGKVEQATGSKIETRLSNILNKTTEIIKEHLKEYHQEEVFKDLFKKHKELTKPEKDMHFFGKDDYKEDDSELYDAYLKKRERIVEKPVKRDYHYKKQNYSSDRLISEIRRLENKVNRALLDQKLEQSKVLYKKLKKLFEKFPVEYYDEKIEIYSDILSINLRIHQLEKHLNKMKAIKEKDNNIYEQENKLLSKKEEMIKLQQKNLEKEMETLKRRSYKAKKPKIHEKYKIKKKRKINNNPSEIKEKIHKKPKPHTKKKENKSLKNKRKKEIKKKESKDKLRVYYKKGLKNMFKNNEEKAKNYFEKILDVNPYYKPAIIRLEQLKAKS